MKIALHCNIPFSLAHGGVQIQIEQTKLGLEKAGVDVEFLRWWDENQSPDIIVSFGRLPAYWISLAQNKGIRVVISDLLTAQGSRPRWRLGLHRIALAAAKRLAPNLISSHYALASACLALTPWEAYLMKHVYGAPEEKVHVVPNGVEEVFLNEPERPRGEWLVCTATITQRKRVLEVAEAAILAKTPVFIIGKPYFEKDPYFIAFQKLAAENPQWIRYEGAISDRKRLAGIYREARGLVLLSTMESLSLSALEAAACGCPLLLSDLPWARVSFAESASYCPIASAASTARVLRRFYDAAPTLPVPPRPLTWQQVGVQLKSIFQDLLKTSR